MLGSFAAISLIGVLECPDFLFIRDFMSSVIKKVFSVVRSVIVSLVKSSIIVGT